MSTDEVTDSIAVRPKGDEDAGELIDNVIENKAVCRKCDTEANETNGKEIENEAVRHKSDMDAEVFEGDSKNEQEHENEAAAAKKTLEVNDEFWEKVVKIRRLVVERRNISKSEKRR